MDFSHYKDNSVGIAAALVNTLDGVTGNDRLTSVPELLSFVAPYAQDWDPGDFATHVPTESDVEEVRAIRTRLRAVFEAETIEEATKGLNQILTDVVATPRISLHGEGPHLHFEPITGRIAQWLGAATAMGLSVVLIEDGIDRFGVCSSPSCGDIFIDTSKNRSRTYCSATCTSRENVAAHRRRARRQRD